MTATLKNSKVITISILGLDVFTVSVMQSLLTRVPAEALTNHVTAQYQYQSQLLEEAKRDLEETKRELAVYKAKAERGRHDLEERFEREKQALSDEIRQLRGRNMHDREEILEQGRRTLDEVHQ